MEQAIIDKLLKALDEILNTFVEVKFFGILRPENQSTWDVLLSGPGINNDAETANSVVKIIQNYITKEDVVSFSRLVILDQDNPIIRSFTSMVNMDRGTMRVNNTIINNVAIGEGIFFRSKK